MEDFSKDHTGRSTELPKEIVDLRFNHFQNKRRSKFKVRLTSVEHFETLAKAMGILDSRKGQRPGPGMKGSLNHLAPVPSNQQFMRPQPS